MSHLHRQSGLSGQSTRWHILCFGIGIGLLTGAASAQSGAPTNFGQKGAPMPRGSFLTTPAKTVKSLNKELDDPTVLARYSKLFNMPPALVRLAIADLKLQPLTEDRNMEVWYVKATPKGEISGYRLRKVKKGTLVYAMQDGTPALIQVCGNPVRMINTPSAALTDLANLPEYEPYSLVLGAGGLGVGSEVNVATLDAAPDDFIEVSMPDVPLPVPVEPPQLLTAHAKRLFALWFAPLLGAIPAFSGIGGGGGGGGGSSFLPLPPPGGTATVPPVFTPTPSAVPEPGTLALLTALTAGGAVCWHRKRKK